MFENVMLAACLTLVKNNLPFAAFPSLINDKRYRHQLLMQVDDPLVIQYFNATFDRLSVKDQIDQAASSLRRVFNLLLSEELRYTIGQQENWLPFREIIDQGKLAIFDLGGLDEESQRFIGALIAHGYEEAAISRSDIQEKDRVPHHLIIDEFAAFSSASETGLARILSQARKYKLTLWLAHQTFGQLSDSIANALQNTTRIAFSLGVSDALIMSRVFQQFEPLAYKFIADEDGRPLKQFYGVQDTFERMATELQNLKPRHMMIRYPATKRHYWFWRKPVIKIATVKTPTVKTETGYADVQALRKRYGERYMRPREDVVREVTALLEQVTDNDAPPMKRTGSIFDN
jgi:AraC-like DNA-binding protein